MGGLAPDGRGRPEKLDSCMWVAQPRGQAVRKWIEAGLYRTDRLATNVTNYYSVGRQRPASGLYQFLQGVRILDQQAVRLLFHDALLDQHQQRPCDRFAAGVDHIGDILVG